MSSLQKVGTLTILNTATASNELTLDQLRPLKSISIKAPATLPDTVTVRSAADDVAGSSFGIVQSPPGTDVTVAAGKVIVLTELPFPRIRLEAAAGVAADRVFEVWGRV